MNLPNVNRCLADVLRFASRFAPERPDALPAGPGVQDLRLVKREGKHKRGRSHGVRDWKQITGITLHQTASGHLHKRHPMLLAVPAHSIIHTDATVTLLHDASRYMYHANSLNSSTIGIEIDCRACGVENDMSTLWLSKRERAMVANNELEPSELALEASEFQIESALFMIQRYCQEAKLAGGRIDYIWAHRQAQAAKPSDPGSRIWRRVALVAAERHGLRIAPPHKNGLPIPSEWMGVRNGISY